MLARKLLRVKLHEYFQHLEDSIEKNRQVSTVSDSDNELPSPRTEAKALFRMVGRNGNGKGQDSLESIESLRALIQVEDKVKKEMFKYAPAEEIKRMLRFRERVLAVFDKLAAKEEQKELRRSRFLARCSVPTDANQIQSF